MKIMSCYLFCLLHYHVHLLLADPIVLSDNQVIDDLHFEEVNSFSVASIRGAEPISLNYVKDAITFEEANQLISLCNDRNGWVPSPQKDAESLKEDQRRTSYSCPLIWPLLYIKQIERIKASGKLTKVVERELNLSWTLTKRF